MVIMYKTEGGFLALYRGILPTVAGVAPYVCVWAADLGVSADEVPRLASTSWSMSQSESTSHLKEKRTLRPYASWPQGLSLVE